MPKKRIYEAANKEKNLKAPRVIAKLVYFPSTNTNVLNVPKNIRNDLIKSYIGKLNDRLAEIQPDEIEGGARNARRVIAGGLRANRYSSTIWPTNAKFLKYFFKKDGKVYVFKDDEKLNGADETCGDLRLWHTEILQEKIDPANRTRYDKAMKKIKAVWEQERLDKLLEKKKVSKTQIADWKNKRAMNRAIAADRKKEKGSGKVSRRDHRAAYDKQRKDLNLKPIKRRDAKKSSSSTSADVEMVYKIYISNPKI